MSAEFFRRHPTRREFLTLGTGVFVFLSLPRVLRPRLTLARRTFPVMGTIAEVQVAHADERLAQDAIDAAMRELQWVEQTMTRFTPTSDIGRANLRARHEGVAVTPETAMVVEAALGWSSLTDGRFDPALGSASALWDILHRHEPPPARDVAPLAARGFWRKVDVAPRQGVPHLRFDDPDLSLDLGAIAKGYGVDRATAVLRSRGIAHAIVTVGGDLYALGGSPDGGPWQVGIRDPHNHAALAGRLEVTDRAVATSGDYERYFEWHGTRYHHLMDPATAAPRRTAVHSNTVLGSTCMHADAAATATFGMPHDAALQLVRRKLTDAEVIPLT